LTFIPPGAFANRLVPDVPTSVIPSQFDGLVKDRAIPPAVKDALRVSLALYRPEFSESERRWYVDIQISPDDNAYFPFVRLGLARYQPNAIAGCELSEIVASEFVQLTPDRSATVTVSSARGALRTVRVDIVGQESAGPAEPEGTDAHSVLVMRVDEAAGRAGRGAPRIWIPKADQDGREELELTYDVRSRAWRGQAQYELPAGKEYSAYLEEREGIIVDGSPHTAGDTTVRAATRVTYVDRIPLRT
jgi:hypothetical protein